MCVFHHACSCRLCRIGLQPYLSAFSEFPRSTPARRRKSVGGNSLVTLYEHEAMSNGSTPKRKTLFKQDQKEILLKSAMIRFLFCCAFLSDQSKLLTWSGHSRSMLDCFPLHTVDGVLKSTTGQVLEVNTAHPRLFLQAGRDTCGEHRNLFVHGLLITWAASFVRRSCRRGSLLRNFLWSRPA